MMIKWRGDRVVVEPAKQTETRSGIIFPDASKAKMRTGLVIGVGPEVYFIRPGDIVYFLKWVGSPITVDNKDAITFSAYHIIGFPI